MNFGEELSLLIGAGLRAGVPAQEIILCLEMCSHELKNNVLARAAVEAEKPLIVPMPDGHTPGFCQ